MGQQYTAEYGPNVEQILARGFRIVTGKVPAVVRTELRLAVKAGIIGHFRKEGLKPEVFFNPNNKLSAKSTRDRHAEYAVECIAKVVAVKPVEQRVAETIAHFSA